ncbi:FHA domain-containing protein [Giardia muris]|uniref:FHA domain-containing protein n=1 Tax=Giardia muris TaxID=5742 RepID=A0A4Z1T446_GIAMU|nr:FHA domain-containing protein [Giardia muris]TNJ27821.1 FHA domain-containing protein [Giardia muris]|eukprot:TNJ27817.1 FHA domain-containing protein [Giardia muris]
MPAGPVLAVLATEHGYFALRAREVSIGRSRSCDVSIAAPSISAQHAHMAIINGDEAHLTDHSRAGTTVNGIRVHQDSVVIRDGDEVRFGLGSPLFRYSTHPPGEHTPVFGCDQAIATEDTESQRSSCQEVAVGPDIFVPTEIEPHPGEVLGELASREHAAQSAQALPRASPDVSFCAGPELRAQPVAPLRTSILGELTAALRETSQDGTRLGERLPVISRTTPETEVELLTALRAWINESDMQVSEMMRRQAEGLLMDARIMRVAVSLLYRDFTTSLRRLSTGTTTVADELLVAQTQVARLAGRLNELVGKDSIEHLHAWEECLSSLLELQKHRTDEM